MVNFHYGDIVKVNLNPVKGHEEGNYRPVVIINRDEYPLPGGINIILPITTHGNNLDKVRPGEIVLDNRTETKGAVMCYQPRTLDLSGRDFCCPAAEIFGYFSSDGFKFHGKSV